MNQKRITFDPRQMGGQACIRGLRVPVATVVRCVASGMSNREIMEAYPDLEEEDIAAALRYVATLAEGDRKVSRSDETPAKLRNTDRLFDIRDARAGVSDHDSKDA